MSLKHPECPLYNHLNCKEYFNPRVCAFVRKEKKCLKKKKAKQKLQDGESDPENYSIADENDRISFISDENRIN